MESVNTGSRQLSDLTAEKCDLESVCYLSVSHKSVLTVYGRQNTKGKATTSRELWSKVEETKVGLRWS